MGASDSVLRASIWKLCLLTGNLSADTGSHQGLRPTRVISISVGPCQVSVAFVIIIAWVSIDWLVIVLKDKVTVLVSMVSPRWVCLWVPVALVISNFRPLMSYLTIVL